MKIEMIIGFRVFFNTIISKQDIQMNYQHESKTVIGTKSSAGFQGKTGFKNEAIK